MKRAVSLGDACRQLMTELGHFTCRSKHAAWQYEIPSFDERAFLLSVRGTWRIAYRSRDCRIRFFGLGAADLIKSDEKDPHDALSDVVQRTDELLPHQLYFGGLRFDSSASIAEEWHHFGRQIFILPLLLVSIEDERIVVSLNFRHDGHLDFNHWCDNAFSLLQAIIDAPHIHSPITEVISSGFTPHESAYAHNIERAHRTLMRHTVCKKVVLGRRRTMVMDKPVDPVELYIRLQVDSKKAFLFLLDDGAVTAFFGGSPELLYRRRYHQFETESLAGTRPRARDELNDLKLREALLNSLKDNHEHQLVSMHIEDRLRALGIVDLISSDLEIMALSYVQHLVRRYRGCMNPSIDDAIIIQALHPTPAVCGLDINWARDFIRENEGFDRGFYAGPIGYISRDNAEFAVGIRSALYHRQSLHIYAASGIVPGSTAEQEWEELNNKERNILSIFDREV